MEDSGGGGGGGGGGGEVYRSGDSDVVTAVEENNLCICEMVTEMWRASRETSEGKEME